MKSGLRLLIAVFFCACVPFSIFAQGVNLSGRIIDNDDTTGLVGVTVILRLSTDSTNMKAAVTDADGKFEIGAITPGTYTLKCDYLGYKPLSQNLNVAAADISLGTLRMKSTAKELKGVTVAGKQARAEQRGDTTQFNADAFKTHKDATAEDLVTKMPGVTSDANGVKVNGEALQQVYVDGKPFFGTDPTLALKNMPSEIIDKIEIFDRLSDQSNFTGFDDGTSQKTMNIMTRKNKSEGTFGKVYAGYGTEGTYQAGGNINIFHGDRRITLIGLTNNINQQNFSAQDLLGVSGGSGQNRGGSGGGGFGGGGRGGGGGGGSNFFAGQQNGITTTNSIGLNYSDAWGKKIKVSGSYFFNSTDNVSNTILNRNYFSNTFYKEYDTSEARNFNHRFNLRLEYAMDSFNTIIFTPGLNLQNNNTSTAQSDTNSSASQFLSTTGNFNGAKNMGYSSSDNFLLQHKFRKQRRTISLNLNASLNEKDGSGSYFSNTELYTPLHDSIIDQHYTLYTNGYTLSANVTYTEPIGKRGQLLANYNPSWQKNRSDKETNDFNAPAGEFNHFDTLFSNKFENTYITHRGGASYRWANKKVNFMFGANLQYATLDGTQSFPYPFTLQKDFTNVLPTAMFNYRFSDGRNLRLMYRTNTQAPTASQLQDILDISNPILLKYGNSDLKQDFEHTFIVRFGQAKAKNAHNFFFNLYANYINDYIGNATYTDSVFTDPVSKKDIRISRGSQLTRPVNLDGYFSMRTFATYGLPVGAIKSNLNFNGGLNINRTPGLINGVINYANNYIPSFGVVLGSNISEQLDFTLSYTGNYNIVKNTVQTQANTTYLNHVTNFKINYVLLKNIVFNTSLSHNYYTAFSSTGDQSYLLWNAYVGYKMLKSKALEARITAFDILNQNKSITRTVTETYIENNNTQVLQQYFMFQLTYTIRNFKGPMPELNSKMPPDGMMRGGPWGGHSHGDDGR